MAAAMYDAISCYLAAARPAICNIQKFYLAEEMDPTFNLNTNIKVPTPHESTPQETWMSVGYQ